MEGKDNNSYNNRRNMTDRSENSIQYIRQQDADYPEKLQIGRAHV